MNPRASRLGLRCRLGLGDRLLDKGEPLRAESWLIQTQACYTSPSENLMASIDARLHVDRAF